MRVVLSLISLLLCLGLLLPAGCGRKRQRETQPEPATSTPASVKKPTSQAAPPTTAATAPVQEADPEAGQGGIPRLWTRQERQDMLKGIVLAYHNYVSTNNRAPSKAADLAEHYERNPKITEALDKGWFKFFYNVKPAQMPEGTSNTILVYENEPDRLGRRLVGMADGSVKEVSQQEFDMMPKAGK
jgi:hypothetical protein